MASPNIPDPLRERLLRQHKRVRFVRVSFAVNAALVLAMMFGLTLVQGLSPTLRVAGVVLLSAEHEKPDALFIDQTIDASAQQPDGSFRLALMRKGELHVGAAMSGAVSNFTMLDEKRALVVFESHYLVFDISGDPEADGWPPLTERKSLGINESEASPTVAVLDGTPWLCWMRGLEVRVRPLFESETGSALVHTAQKRGASLDMVSADNRLWLTVTEKSGQMKLFWFKPRVDTALAEGTDADGDAVAEKPGASRRVANIGGLHISDVSKEVRRSSLAVVSGMPVVVISQRDRDNAPDRWELWRLEDGKSWVKDTKPEFPAGSLLPAISSLNLSARGDALAALYSDSSTVRLSMGKVENGKVVWSEPRDIEIGKSRGFGPLLAWLVVLISLLLLLAGQGVWLLLNRSQELDRTLAGLLQEGKKEPRPKSETMMHASQLARALSIAVDLAITSPVVIMLKSVYDYEWDQAYGFLLFHNMGQANELVGMLQASLVTLSVLALYGMVCETIWGRTFGKALLHLRVVDAEGEQPAVWKIVVRNIVRIFEMAHWAIFLIPAALMMLSGKQQRLGDMLARTYVIVELVPEDQTDDLEI